MLGLGLGVHSGVALGPETVSNTYSLAFDGTNDYIATSGDGTLADATYSFWAKSTETGNNYGVFGHGSDTIGAFHLNVGNAPFLTIGGATNTRRFWTDVTAQDDGNWHHWVVYIDGTSIVDSKLYMDGDLQTVSSTNGTTTIAAYSSNLTIGGSTGSFFEGSLDEFAHWDKELTSTEISAIYNNVRLDLSKDSGGYESSSDLQGWWRMGDGTLDDFPLIADQVNPTLGSDVVEADTADLGSFDTDTTGSWTANNAITHNSGTGDATVTHIGNGSSWIMLKNFLTSGKVYKATFKAKATGDTSYLSLTNSSGAGHYYGASLNPALSTTYQNYEFLFITKNTFFEFSTSSSATSYIGTAPDSGDTFTFDDIVIIEVNGNAGVMINMESGDIESDVP